MMPYTQISNYGGNQLPPSLYFGTQTGEPDGGGARGGKGKAPKKAAKKAPPKAKKKR
jgi:hypothetical protein